MSQSASEAAPPIEPIARPAARPSESSSDRAAPARREWVLPLVLYVALALAACGSAILGWSALGPEKALDADSLYGALPEDVVPVHNDPTPVVLDLPRDLTFARGLHAGRLDVWSPSVGCGAPLWAEQGGPFFPLKLPFYLWPSRSMHHVFLALRLVAAAFGAFLLARRRRQTLAAAMIAGALFEMSGALFAHVSFAAASAVYMLPWVLLGAQAIADAPGARERGRAAAGAAIALGVTGHGGHPTLIGMVFAAFAFSILGHAITLAWRRPGGLARAASVSLFAGLAAGLGLAIAAPVLLPLAELASVGRSYKDTESGVRIWTQDLGRFRRTLPIALFAPHLLEPIRKRIDQLFPYMFAPTLGVLGLLLGLAGIGARRIGLSLLLPLALGVALASAPPGFRWVHDVPLLRLIMPQYPWSLAALPLCIAAGHAIDGLDEPRVRTALVGAALVVVAGAFSLRLLDDEPVGSLRFRLILMEALKTTSGRALYYAPLAISAGLAMAIALVAALPGRRSGLVLGVLAIGELGAITLPPTRLPPSLTLQRPDSEPVRFLAERMHAESSRMMGVPYKVGHPNTTMMYGLDDVRQVSALPVRRFVNYITSIANPVGFTVQAVDRRTSPLFDMAAVRWLVVRRIAAPPEPHLAKDTALPLRWRDTHVAIYENTRALPRFRVVHAMMPTPTTQLAAYHIASLGRMNGPANRDGPVSIEPDAAGRYPAPLPGGAVADDEQVHVIEGSDPDRLVLEARLDRDGLVLAADTFYPGWSATVDGKAAPIYAADMLFRAVAVPAGTHRIEMRYRSRPMRFGFLFFAGAALSCFLLARAGRRREI